MAQLAGLRLFEGQAHGDRETPGERSPAEVEHPGAFDAAVAQQRDVGRAAADVYKDAALLPRLVPGRRAGQRVGLRHGGDQLEIKLPDDRLDRADLRDRRERVEYRHLERAALEADRVRDRVAVDPHLGDGRVDKARLELAVAPLQLQQVLRLSQGAPLDELEEILELRLA